MRRLLTLLTTATVLAFGGTPALLAVAASPALAAAPTVRPGSDPFYTYSGSTPLADVAPGTVLDTRDVTLAAATNSLPIPATQILYRTVDEQGAPTATVTTVAVPPTATATLAADPGAATLVAYLSFYDSLSDKCDPSYTLTGGDPGADNAQLTEVEQALVAQYYAEGWIVTVPDFEGPDLHWTAGHEAGWSTLDSIRATESFLSMPDTTKVALSGYSGGSIAGDWAAELAPSYAPELNLVGAAVGGLPVNFANNLHYIEGSNVWSGIIPAVLVALARAYDIDLATYASPKGLELAQKVSDECIGDFSGTTPGLTSDELLKPEYQPLLSNPEFVDVVNSLIMGSAPGRPQIPMLIEVGNDPDNADGGPNDTGQGDDIMLTGDVQSLAYEYCQQGGDVQFQVLDNSPHSQAALEFEPQATAWIAARFAGAPTTPNCDTITPGSDISPVSVQPRANASTPGPSASTPGPSASTPSTGGSADAGQGTAAPVASAPRGPSGGLASTGGVPLLAVVGASLAVAAATVARRRRPGDARQD